MANLTGFNANEHEPAGDFDPIPAGEYHACIVGSEMKETKNGKGKYLQLEFQVLRGEHENRKLWTRLNLENPNPQAVQIAKGELSAICRAVGVLTPKDSAELHNKPLILKVKVKKREDNGEPANEISSYKSEGDGNARPAPAQQAASAPTEAPSQGKTAPWARK